MVVEVSIELPFLMAKLLGEFDEAFHKICRSWRWAWSPIKRCYYKRVGATTGSAEDRAAELVRALMDAGAVVTCAAPGVLELAASGEAIEPEWPRWVVTSGPWFALKVKPGDDFLEQFRAVAEAFAGMTWNNKRARLEVPKERFEEVEDLAEMHGFRFSPKALELLAQAKKGAAVKKKTQTKSPDGVLLDLLDD